ncbi:MAG: Acriflavin resistance protein, partial [Patescibacteria group bacterium]|nr:Acriflavin resistance protein [Patescibacteria group bacterium]
MSDLQFLKKLRFDKNLNNSFVAKYLSNPRLLILFLLAIIVVGTSSYFSLPRRLNPEINIPIIVVSTVLPGASPSDVESLVSEPLESTVTGLSNVKQVNSTSRDNVSVLQIEFESGIDTEKARTDVQSAIDQVDLPEDAQAPRVQKIDFENQPVWSFAVIGKGDSASLSQFSKTLQDELESTASIKDVQISGREVEEISVEIRPEAVALYGINPITLSQSIRSAVSSFPAGSVRTDNSNFSLNIDPTITSIEDVRNLQVSVNGSYLPLSSVAQISQKSKPNQFSSYFANHEVNGEKTVTFNIYKTETANIDKAVHDAEQKIEEVLAPYNGQFEVLTITNAGEEINEQFNHLIRDFLLTTALVFVALFVFLGARQAIVSLFAVPLTFLISFTVMRMLGISLNFLSMFSLLLSLGLLVDDTIVVISAMTQYFRSGKFTPLQTGLLVWRDFLIAIITTTLTTVWAFLPLLISTGIIGEFIKSIPIVVSTTLIASLVVAMFVTLPLMIILLKPSIPSRVVIFLRILLVVILLSIFFIIVPKGPTLIFAIFALVLFLFVTANVRLALIRRSRAYYKEVQKENKLVKNAPNYIDSGLISFNTIGRKYRKLLTRLLEKKESRRMAIIMVVIFSLFSYMLVPFGFVKNEFFPSSDQKYLYLSV